MVRRELVSTRIIPLLLTLALLCPSAYSKVIYVDDDAPVGGDGKSWSAAYRYLQDGLKEASSGDEIDVAQGTYRPDQGGGIAPGDRTASFYLVKGVALNGGYAGLGKPDPDARDVRLHETILTGDLSGNDAGHTDDPSRSENSYHVISSYGTDETCVVDGFTVTGGNANAGPYDNGGGMACSGSRPLVNNCTFRQNRAEYFGGGAVFASSSGTIQDCIFSDNSAPHGGGMANLTCTTTISNCTFSRNSAVEGGAMRNDGGAPRLTNCTFSGNSAPSYGGGLFNLGSNPTLTDCVFKENRSTAWFGGGISNFDSSPVVVKCMFVGNSALDGGGMDNAGYSGVGYSDPTVTNCTFSGNVAQRWGGAICDYARTRSSLMNCTFTANKASTDGGGAIFYGWDEVSGTATNCIVWENVPVDSQIKVRDDPPPSVTYSSVQGGWQGEGNIDIDPCFAKPGYWDSKGTSSDPNDDVWVDGDYHLKSRFGRWEPVTQTWVKDDVNSPCIDGGDPNSPVGREPVPNGGRIDMGGYGGTAEASLSSPGVQPVVQPVAHWTFDEGTGTLAHDVVGTNHGTVHGAVWTSGKVGNALWFDGVQAYVDCGNNAVLVPEQMTLALWLCPDSQYGTGSLVGKVGSGIYDVDYSLKVGMSGTLMGSFGDGSHGVTVFGGKVGTGEWSHVAFTRDGREAALYINGADRTSAGYSFQPGNGGYLLRIGDFYKGKIDDARIYDRALEPDQIKGIAEGKL